MEDGFIGLFGEARCGCGRTERALVIGVHPQAGPVFAVPQSWSVVDQKLITPGKPPRKIVRCPKCARKAANADAGRAQALVPSMDAGVKRGT